MKKDKMSGAKLPWIFYDDRGIPVDPDLPALTAEDREEMCKMFERAMPKINKEYISKPIIYGTGRDFDSGDASIFYNPNVKEE